MLSSCQYFSSGNMSLACCGNHNGFAYFSATQLTLALCLFSLETEVAVLNIPNNIWEIIDSREPIPKSDLCSPLYVSEPQNDGDAHNQGRHLRWEHIYIVSSRFVSGSYHSFILNDSHQHAILSSNTHSIIRWKAKTHTLSDTQIKSGDHSHDLSYQGWQGVKICCVSPVFWGGFRITEEDVRNPRCETVINTPARMKLYASCAVYLKSVKSK